MYGDYNNMENNIQSTCLSHHVSSFHKAYVIPCGQLSTKYYL